MDYSATAVRVAEIAAEAYKYGKFMDMAVPGIAIVTGLVIASLTILVLARMNKI